MDSLILKMKKGFTKNTHLALDELNSINLNSISERGFLNPKELRFFKNLNYDFLKKNYKEDAFRGYLSTYIFK
jgi:hypothetical protein